MTAVEPAPMTESEAKAVTSKIRNRVAMVWDLVTQAYEGRAWLALGYESWDAYCSGEFKGARLRLPREERAAAVASLRDAGLSVRAIAAATGTGVATVHRDLEAGVPNGTPATPSPDAPASAPPAAGSPTREGGGAPRSVPTPAAAPSPAGGEEVSPAPPAPHPRPAARMTGHAESLDCWCGPSVRVDAGGVWLVVHADVTQLVTGAPVPLVVASIAAEVEAPYLVHEAEQILRAVAS